jgi:hypothetical protein
MMAFFQQQERKKSWGWRVDVWELRRKFLVKLFGIFMRVECLMLNRRQWQCGKSKVKMPHFNEE